MIYKSNCKSQSKVIILNTVGDAFYFTDLIQRTYKLYRIEYQMLIV